MAKIGCNFCNKKTTESSTKPKSQNPDDKWITKELKETLGAAFTKKCGKTLTYLGDDQVEFLPEKQTGEEILTTDGKSYKMLGKPLFFRAIWSG